MGLSITRNSDNVTQTTGSRSRNRKLAFECFESASHERRLNTANRDQTNRKWLDRTKNYFDASPSSSLTRGVLPVSVSKRRMARAARRVEIRQAWAGWLYNAVPVDPGYTRRSMDLTTGN